MVRTGKWYRTSDGREMQVLHIDADEGTVEIEYSDGDPEILDLDTLVNDVDLYPITRNPGLDFVDDWQADGGDRHTLYDVLDSMNY